MFFFSDKSIHNIEHKIDFLVEENEKQKAEIDLLKQKIVCNQEQIMKINQAVIKSLDYLERQNSVLVSRCEQINNRIADNEALRKESAVSNAAEIAKLSEVMTEKVAAVEASLGSKLSAISENIADNEAARKESISASAAEVAKLGELLSESKSAHNNQDVIAKLNQLNKSVKDCSSISKKNNYDLNRILNDISLVDDATRLIMLSSVIDKIDLNNDEKR